MAEENYKENLFHELLARYTDYVYRYFRTMLGPEEAGEFAQDTFLRVHREIEDYNKDNAKSLIFSTAHKLLVRKKKKEIYMYVEESLEEKLDDLQKVFFARELVNKIDYKYRMPIIYFHYFDKNYKEIAELLGITTGCVKTRIIRGKEKIAEEARRLKNH